MFVGLHEKNLIVRLSESERERALAKSSAKPFVVNGRAMREYVAIGDTVQRRQNDVATLVKSAFDFASGLAPKVKKEAKATTVKSKGKPTAKSKGNKRDWQRLAAPSVIVPTPHLQI